MADSPTANEQLPAWINMSPSNLLALLMASDRTDLLWMYEERVASTPPTRCWACAADRPEGTEDCPNCGSSAVSQLVVIT